MNEETKVFDEITTEEVTEEIIEATEESGNGVFYVVAGGATIAAISLLAWLGKKSKKLDDWRIKQLEKKGYVVTKPEPVEDEDEPCTISVIE